MFLREGQVRTRRKGNYHFSARQQFLPTDHVSYPPNSKNYVDIFLPYFDLLSFDFAGCGLSEGQYVTLGYNEKEDLYSVISRVREKYGVRDIILWGRSMGAATCLLYASKYGGVKAIISDNCFSDL